MKKLIYDPAARGRRMTIVCFISGSGTNYEQIVQRGPDHRYVVFTNRPECAGADRARQNHHELITLSHAPYLRRARREYGPGRVPRNHPDRTRFEQDAWRLIEESIQQRPDLVCLAGYDQLTTDWLVDRLYPGLLNVHPGDTTRGYAGLHWAPTAMAILAGDECIRSTLFLVDKGTDTGPVLVQSRALNIRQALADCEAGGEQGLVAALDCITSFARDRGITSHGVFERESPAGLREAMRRICERLQEALKVHGDWEIYPFAVHGLIGRGRVAVDGRTVYVDGVEMPPHGLRMDALPPAP